MVRQSVLVECTCVHAIWNSWAVVACIFSLVLCVYTSVWILESFPSCYIHVHVQCVYSVLHVCISMYLYVLNYMYM